MDLWIYNLTLNTVCYTSSQDRGHLMARAVPPSGQPNMTPSSNKATDSAWDVELLRVLVSRTGTQVEAQWAIHPQLKHDLLPKEWQEVKDLMAKVTDIVGNRFSETLSNVDPMPPGHA
ncbi:MAG: hypothetical protein NDI90_00990 [Nitrospira sp. BO4]|nr:hypothetical protein [Nitrospira sp. BO4]